MGRVKNMAKLLLGFAYAGRKLTVYPDDIFLVSYPKSGNTWLRFLLSNLVYKEPATWTNVDRKIPDIHTNTQRRLRQMSQPRILKSHDYFDPRYKRVVCIVRDPRDVVISYYYYHIKVGRITEDYPLDHYVSRFVAGDLDSFGSWGENVGSWVGAKQDSDGFLLLRYEDMLKQPEHELGKIATFLSIGAVDEQLSQAIQLSSATHMRKLEKETVEKLKRERISSLLGTLRRGRRDRILRDVKTSRGDLMFVRSAKEGSWRSELPENSVVEIEEAWGSLMHKLGYNLLSETGGGTGASMAPIRLSESDYTVP
jgi:hypothetical protein